MRKYLIILLSLFAVAGAAAQKLPQFHVVSFTEKPFDTAAHDERYKIVDGNGDLFSIIKLVSNNPDDDLHAYSFDFGYPEHRMKTVNGNVWIYIQRNAMHVTIKRDGYRTLHDYELSATVQPGKVYEMTLSAEARPVYREILQFNIKPSGVNATVMYKKEQPDAQLQLFGTADEEGSVAKSLELGVYIYEVYSDNYHKSEGRIELNKDKGTHVEDITLRPKFSNITLEAGEGVDIYINNEKVGRGSWSGILNAGTYTVECKKEKHKSVTENITVAENRTETIRLGSPVPIVGALAIISRPLGAHITIDGKGYGVTPKTIDNLLIGKHEVTLSRANYKKESFTVDIVENDVVEKNVTLNDMAVMKISSTPSGAKLFVDGKHAGFTPYTAKMASGDYSLRLEKAGYCTFEKRVHLDSSNPQATYSLKRQYQKRYSGYVEAAGSVGNVMGLGFNAGCYLYNINVEAYGMFGLSPARLYVNNLNIAGLTKYNFSPMMFGGRLGYGFILGSRFRLTPQFGVGSLLISNSRFDASAVTLSGALRCECAVAKFFGVSVVPEYSYAVSKGELYKEFAGLSPKMNGWGTGFNVRVGAYFYF